jgi:hypothetical protein
LKVASFYRAKIEHRDGGLTVRPPSYPPSPNPISVPMTPEEWRPAPGFPAYEVSSLGRVRNVRTGRVLKLSIGTNGYYKTRLSDRTVFVHRLVCEVFQGPPGTYIDALGRTLTREVCHRDGDKKNNAADNLGWSTHLDNMRHMIRHGTRPVGERHGQAKLTEADVRAIRASNKSQDALAREFGIGQPTISNIRSGKRWSHLR